MLGYLLSLLSISFFFVVCPRLRSTSEAFPLFSFFPAAGDLVLSLTKDTYNELGLEGQASSFQPGSRHSELSICSRHVISSPLRISYLFWIDATRDTHAHMEWFPFLEHDAFSALTDRGCHLYFDALPIESLSHWLINSLTVEYAYYMYQLHLRSAKIHQVLHFLLFIIFFTKERLDLFRNILIDVSVVWILHRPL